MILLSSSSSSDQISWSRSFASLFNGWMTSWVNQWDAALKVSWKRSICVFDSRNRCIFLKPSTLCISVLIPHWCNTESCLAFNCPPSLHNSFRRTPSRPPSTTPSPSYLLTCLSSSRGLLTPTSCFCWCSRWGKPAHACRDTCRWDDHPTV